MRMGLLRDGRSDVKRGLTSHRSTRQWTMRLASPPTNGGDDTGLAVFRKSTYSLGAPTGERVNASLSYRQEDDWVTSYWRTTEKNRLARYYELTPPGRWALTAAVARWRAYRGAMDRVIGAA